VAGDLEIEKLLHQLAHALNANGRTIVTAESCTGGGLAEALTSVPNSSAWFERGFIVYSNTAKREMLGVKAATLARFGAVSEQTARAMAMGALDHSHGDLAVAITGIAGPSGGTPEKPVGTVCFAWVNKRQEARTLTHLFQGDRQAIRRQAVIFALQDLLSQNLKKT
jgi:nicotinamide-nucleotide amidase